MSFHPRWCPGRIFEEDAEPADEAASAMLSGGHAIVYVAEMDAAVRFYSDVLGLNLTNRYGDKWATVEAGRNLVIGLHPRTARSPAPVRRAP